MNKLSSAPRRYGTRISDCRFGMPHDFIEFYNAKTYKIEKCKLCGIRKRWNKGYKGRINNTEYLFAHVRQFAQPNGSTKRVHAKLYSPEKLIIYL